MPSDTLRQWAAWAGWAAWAAWAARVARTASIPMLALACLGTARAEEHAATRDLPLTPLYRQECAACHVAYPPGLLPAASWRRLLSGLDHHFGTDASLDPATAATLSRWLVSVAREGPAPPEDRITRSAWFVREHDEVPADAWSRPSVKSPSRCAACHTTADRGVFDEHAVRLPR